MLITFLIILQTAVLLWLAYEYIKVKKLLRNIIFKMQMDDILDELIEPPSTPVNTGSSQHRERLIMLAAGGQMPKYNLKLHTVDQIESMSDVEIEKMYGRYESNLGAAMTKTLGTTAITFYCQVAKMILPIPPKNEYGFHRDMEADPFVEHALSSAACELYHRYGMYLAPFTTILTTINHCEFNKQPIEEIQISNNIDNDARDQQITGAT